ncbi:hypothetical protein EGT49_03770 [Companilactobacillus suantsaicola]|uniref:Uncharacterized protein n=1 Tax=Companilactobacillus suantsaicola TaxID=2487723 RepID=A0A4Z0JMS0_9LACO|nr:hypothetical protein [Companilactobacillus suantsaicola]TGD24387.1 hypothetical protein EGT49_03770 [Companilactobacillus suantsaicola]
MAIQINLINGKNIEVTDDTFITAWKYQSSVMASNADHYYLDCIFQGKFEDGKVTEDDEENKLEGLISASDWMTFGKNKNSIKSTAVLGITRE